MMGSVVEEGESGAHEDQGGQDDEAVEDEWRPYFTGGSVEDE